MEVKRVKRKQKDGGGPSGQSSQTAPVHNTQLSTSLIGQSAPPVIRLKHSSTPANTSHGSGKHSAAQSETQNDSVSKVVHDAVHSAGKPLDVEARAQLESRTGHDLSHIRVHTDEQSAASAQALNARAYTVGPHIVFGQRQYAPHTTDGLKLLAHEAAHALHQAESGVARPGVAPPDSTGEQRADEFAASLTNPSEGRANFTSPLSFRNWGQAWQIHAQSIVTRGTVAHSGQVGAPAPGQVGVPVGSVEVRTGEEVQLPSGARIPNVIALEYSGAVMPNSRWLQFVWFELLATTPAGIARVSGNVPTTSGTKPFTVNPRAPNWSVDSASTTDPFYEATGLSLRTASATTLFDAPGGASVAPLASAVFTSGVGATAVVFRAHFETYLIQNNAASYRVSYSASTTFTRAGANMTVGAIGYTVGASGPQVGLPTHLKSVLDKSYKNNNVR